jgi:uncharacterized protein YgiM (DUF1202 family)
MKKALTLTLFLLLQCFLVWGQEIRYVSAGQLNLREQPDKTGSVIQALPKGTEVEVMETYNDGWSKVSVDGVEGYVSSNFLIEDPHGDSQQAQQQETPHASPQSRHRPSAPQVATVYICDSRTAYAYHRSTSCRGLNRCSHPLRAVSQTDATGSYGRQACKICY